MGRVDIFAKRTGEDREKLPEKEDGPKQQGQEIRPVVRSEIPGGQTEADAASQTQHAKTQKHEHAGDQFQTSADGSQRIYKELPADAADGGKLLAGGGTGI